MCRVHWIALAATLLLASCAMRGDGVAGPRTATTLKEAYVHDFLIGVAVNDETIAGKDPAAQALALRQFNAVSPENVLKAESLCPQHDVYEFARADAYVDFGVKHRMFVVGHTLVWHNQVPAWFFTDAQGRPNDRAAQIERLRSHIEAVAGRYNGRIRGWDVVNERSTKTARIATRPGCARSATATNWCAALSNSRIATRQTPSCITTNTTPSARASATAWCAW